jgi:hypothetical protein
VIPAVKKAEIRDQLTVLTKRVLEAAKAAAAANKEVAVAEAVAAADEAVAAGERGVLGHAFWIFDLSARRVVSGWGAV